ncbi:MAG TPA: alpha/beta fold hydrolase [Clostridia bacterium]
MPIIDMPLHELKKYQGINPRPHDFDEFWDKTLKELDSIDPDVKIMPCRDFEAVNAECYDLYFTSLGNARIYAKYLRPKKIDKKCPVILMFHGYGGHSGDWADKTVYTNAGFIVLAMDTRGQGGKSEDNNVVKGTTQKGCIIRGIDDSPEKLLYRYIFSDTAMLARIAQTLDDVDPDRIYAAGGSQGGALTLACAALAPNLIKKIAPVYPFLCDYKRVYEMDLIINAYEELTFYIRNFAPTIELIEPIWQKLGYIDLQYLAPRIKAEVLWSIGLMDNVCPPSCQFAAYNKITSKKDLVIYPNFGHEWLPLQSDKQYMFFTKDY